MSRQICFFATQSDVDILIQHIYTLGAILVDYTGSPLAIEKSTSNGCNNLQPYWENNCLITKPECSLFYTESEKFEIDPYISEVIEFRVCTPIPKNILDTSSIEKVFKKGEFIVVDDSEKYNQLLNKLMLNPIYIENPCYVENGFEHGRFWYTAEFLGTDGEKNKKTEALDKLFNSLKKYIKTNFILSKDKFAYIGPDAYKKYLLGTFVPCSGKNPILF